MQVGTFPEQAGKIISGLGGIQNIGHVSCDPTVLTVIVHNPMLVDKTAVLAAPAWEVTIYDKRVTIVLGKSAQKIVKEIKSVIEH